MIGMGSATSSLHPDTVIELTHQGLSQIFKGRKKVLCIIPDSTRSSPIGQLFPTIVEIAKFQNCHIDFLIALGTHPPLSDREISNLVGVDLQDLNSKYKTTRIFNHDWKDKSQLSLVGHISKSDTFDLTSGLLCIEIPVIVNRLINDYDLVLICGPVFPHEVAGFSGGEKYLFPGVSGEEIIHITHWIGALATNLDTIGKIETPVRRILNKAVQYINTDIASISFCMVQKQVYGIYIGGLRETWLEAVNLSAKVNIKYLPKQYYRVLSAPSHLYSELWTAAKAMYKLEPIVSVGGELILYAPELSEISKTHCQYIKQVGYHVVDFFNKNWEKYEKFPWAVLAHATHLKGKGTYENHQENPRICVSLATKIPEAVCKQINIGYINPSEIVLDDWSCDVGSDRLLIRNAGEVLYKPVQ